MTAVYPRYISLHRSYNHSYLAAYGITTFYHRYTRQSALLGCTLISCFWMGYVIQIWHVIIINFNAFLDCYVVRMPRHRNLVMSHVIEFYVKTCHMSQHNQLKLLLYETVSTNAKIPNYKSAILTINIALTYIPHIYSIKFNEKVCIIKRY